MMSTSRQSYHFIFSFWTTLFTILGVSIFLSLASWQWYKGQEKQKLEKLYQERLHATPLSFAEILQQSNPEFYPTKISGYFDNKHFFILLSKFRHHQVGVEILTPFYPQLNNLSAKNREKFKVILVNRGWLKQTAGPESIPHFPITMGLQSITGIITIPKKNRWLQETSTENWPKFIRTMDMEAIQQQLGVSIYPYILLQTQPTSSGFITDWVLSNTSAAKHFGYAVQWVLFAIIALGVYLKFHIIKRK